MQHRTMCPKCGKLYSVAERCLGRVTTCKVCGQRFRIKLVERLTEPRQTTTSQSHQEGSVAPYRSTISPAFTLDALARDKPGFMRCIGALDGMVLGVTVTHHDSNVLACGRGRSPDYFMAPETGQIVSWLISDTLRKEFEDPNATVRCITASSSKDAAVAGLDGGSVAFYTLSSGHHKKTVRIGLGDVNSVAFLSDGSSVICANKEPGVVIITNSGRIKELAGHYDKVKAVAESQGGEVVLSGSLDGTLRQWAMNSEKEITRIEVGEQIHSLAISNGCIAYVGLESGNIIGYDVARKIERIRFVGHSWIVRALALANSDKRLVSVSQDGTMRVWDVENGLEIWNSGVEKGSRYGPKIWKSERDTGAIYALAVSPAGRIAITGSQDNSICLWTLPVLK